MKPTLRPGLSHRFSYKVPENKTVPHLYPEVADFPVRGGMEQFSARLDQKAKSLAATS